MSSSASEVWKVDFYVDEVGSFPVRILLDRVSEEVRGKVLARINLLKTGGPTLDFPYTSQIEGKLRVQVAGGQESLPRAVFLR